MRFGILYVVARLATLAIGLGSIAGGQTFEVASVKLFNTEIPQPYIITGGPGTNDPGRYRAPRVNMPFLLSQAFGLALDQVKGPAWLLDPSANNYTIVATMPSDTTKEQFRKMLQNLLAERFHLAFHRETRDFPGYALVVDKGGPKFKEVASTVPANAPPDMRSIVAMGMGPDGFPKLPPGPQTMTISRSGEQRTKYQERTMAEFVSNLGLMIGSPQANLKPRVIDQTGLTGRYSFLLEYFNEGMAALSAQFRPPGNSDAANSAPPAPSNPGSSLPNIFGAIQNLGLRLEKSASVPLDVMVIENLDKVPTPD